MSFFTHILVPTDFSQAADRALDCATEIADKFRARITLFHAVGSPASSFSGDAPKTLAWSVDEVRKSVEKKMSDVLSKAQKRCPNAEAYVVEGDPWTEIPAFARTHGVDLIVLGTHGRRGIAHALFGSVSEKVAHRSYIPILTVSRPSDVDTWLASATQESPAPR